jgi:hypothetical protein
MPVDFSSNGCGASEHCNTRGAWNFYPSQAPANTRTKQTEFSSLKFWTYTESLTWLMTVRPNGGCSIGAGYLAILVCLVWDSGRVYFSALAGQDSEPGPCQPQLGCHCTSLLFDFLVVVKPGSTFFCVWFAPRSLAQPSTTINH